MYAEDYRYNCDVVFGMLVLSPGFLKNSKRVLLQQTEMFEQHKGVQYCKLADIDMQV